MPPTILVIAIGFIATILSFWAVSRRNDIKNAWNHAKARHDGGFIDLRKALLVVTVFLSLLIGLLIVDPLLTPVINAAANITQAFAVADFGNPVANVIANTVMTIVIPLSIIAALGFAIFKMIQTR